MGIEVVFGLLPFSDVLFAGGTRRLFECGELVDNIAFGVVAVESR